MSVVASLLHSLRFWVRSRAALHLEIVALRHQLVVTSRTRRPRLRLTALDRALWVWLAHQWRGWRSTLHVVQPATVLAWRLDRRGRTRMWSESSVRSGASAFDHVIAVKVAGFRRVLTAYVAYYMRSPTHLGLGKDTPSLRPVTPPSTVRLVAIPEVGGLHHRYDRIAA